jgi:enoyl-CoA hydratase
MEGNTMRDLKHLRWDEDGSVATVWLDRAPVNAIDQEMYREITAFFSDPAGYVPAARTIVLAGAGKYFSAGNDLKDFQTMNPDNAGARLQTIIEASFAIYDAPLPVIAAVQGVALGSGVVLAASCDLIVAATGTMFGLPEVAMGVTGGASHASRLVPQGIVRYLHLTADSIAAEDLVQYGGILKVVPEAQLMPTARDVASRIARHSPVALRFAKKSLNTIESLDLKSAFEHEQSLSGELSGYSDSKEAVNAYFEKREPQYTGR